MHSVILVEAFFHFLDAAQIIRKVCVVPHLLLRITKALDVRLESLLGLVKHPASSSFFLGEWVVRVDPYCAKGNGRLRQERCFLTFFDSKRVADFLG